MKHRSSRKIQVSSSVANLKKKNGFGTLICIFIFFIFSTLGLSLIYLSQVYLKLSAFKKNSTTLDYSSENGIKQGFDHFVSLISDQSSPSILSPEQGDEFRENAQMDGLKLVEEILGANLPLVIQESWKRMSWRSSTDCLLEQVIEKENYFSTIYKVIINSEGMIKNFKPVRKSSLEASLKIFVGHIPLPFFPLLIDKKLSQEQKENFMEKNEISFLPSKENQIPPQITFSEKELIPEEANSLLSKALKIDIFYPQNLSQLKLRTVLGLEKINKPVPDGVYLIKDDLGLGGIYAQGDIEEIVTAIEDEFQVITFRTKQGCWILKFSPTKSKTLFSTPKETLCYDLIPLGIIIVNGKINSLGGGAVDSSGRATLIKDKEIPSILRGVNLTIICSDKITLSSHLIHQGVKWQEGLPYIKDSESQLIIFASGQDFFQNRDREGEITIDKNSPQEIKIQASLTASGKGFTIEGKDKTVHILGSLQASDYLSNENTLKIAFDERVLEENYLPENAPETTKPVLYPAFFRVLEWQEYR